MSESVQGASIYIYILLAPCTDSKKLFFNNFAVLKIYCNFEPESSVDIFVQNATKQRSLTNISFVT